MSNKKHVDRLFQEKLKYFEATPDDAVWKKIHDRLHKDKRKRRLIPLWWKIAGVAALLAILFGVGSQFISGNLDSKITNEIVDTEKESEDHLKNDGDQTKVDESDSDEIKNKINSSSNVVNQDSSNPTNENIQNSNVRSDEPATSNLRTNEDSKNTLNGASQNRARITTNLKNDSNKENNSDTSRHPNEPIQKANSDKKDAVATISENDKNGPNQNIINGNKEVSDINKMITDSKKNSNWALTDVSLNKEELTEDSIEEEKTGQSIEEAIAETNTEVEKEKKLNRWNVSPNVAPVYFNSLGKGSSLDEQFVNNEKTGSVNMSYGINGSYSISEKIKIRAGVNRVELGYSTNDVIAYQGVSRDQNVVSAITNSSGHIDLNDGNQNVELLSAKNMSFANAPAILNTLEQVSLDQQFGYIEVPLELEYGLVNNRFGLNVIGGFSTLFLNKNEIYSVVNGSEIRIGEANNINDMSYSANFGLGLNYNFSKKIKMNVEPTFKYQINTFNGSSGNFQPFFIGIYTGLSYKF